MGVTMLVSQLIGLLSVILSIGGLTVSLLALRRTRWAAVLAAGFGLEAVVGLFNRVAVPLLASSFGMDAWRTIQLASSILFALSTAAIVGGVAGVLADLRTSAAATADEPPAASRS